MENENFVDTAENAIEYKYCIHCNEKIKKDMNFCTACGKSQTKTEVVPFKKTAYERKKAVNKKRKREEKNILLTILSIILFAGSFFSFVFGIFSMIFVETGSFSLFSTGNDKIILSLIYVVGFFMMSLITLIAGIFLYGLRKKG